MESQQTTIEQNVSYDADKVAQMLGVLTDTWLRWVMKGLAPQPVRIGETLQWSADDLLEWVEQLKSSRVA